MSGDGLPFLQAKSRGRGDFEDFFWRKAVRARDRPNLPTKPRDFHRFYPAHLQGLFRLRGLPFVATNRLFPAPNRAFFAVTQRVFRFARSNLRWHRKKHETHPVRLRKTDLHHPVVLQIEYWVSQGHSVPFDFEAPFHHFEAKTLFAGEFHQRIRHFMGVDLLSRGKLLCLRSLSSYVGTKKRIIWKFGEFSRGIAESAAGHRESQHNSVELQPKPKKKVTFGVRGPEKPRLHLLYE